MLSLLLHKFFGKCFFEKNQVPAVKTTEKNETNGIYNFFGDGRSNIKSADSDGSSKTFNAALKPPYSTYALHQ